MFQIIGFIQQDGLQDVKFSKILVLGKNVKGIFDFLK